MAQLDGKQIRIGNPTDGQYGTNSQAYGLTPSLNLPDALDTLASNINQVAASASITVVDYNTGASVSGVQNIIFRGGKVTVPAGNGYPGGGWTATAITGTVPTAIVWIPAPPTPTWKPEFSGNPAITLVAGADRYISDPATNGWTTSVIPGYYGIGDWSGEADRSVQHKTLRYTQISSPVVPFTYFGDNDFAIFGGSSSVTFTLHNYDGSTMSTVSGTISTSLGAQVLTSDDGFLTLNIGSASVDDGGLGDAVSLYTPPVRYYCPNLTVSANISTLFPNGGRFKFTTQVVYYNESLTIQNYGNDTGDKFYDNEDATYSPASIGSVVLDELTPVVRYQSGVAYYTNGVVFGYTVSNIDNLNALSQPLVEQLDVLSTNPLGGGAVNNIAGSPAITGWTNSWDDTGDTYGKTWSASYGGFAQYPGGFSGSTNLVSETPNASVTATVYDWSPVDTQQSNQMLVLVDTTTGTSAGSNIDNDPPTTVQNPIDGESWRIPVSQVLTNGAATYVSANSLLTTYNDELQYIFGRYIFPQQNFTTFFPTTNFPASVNYSTATGVSKNFTCYNNTGSDPGTTSNEIFNPYRWFVTSFGSYQSDIGNGTITFVGDVTEADLHYNGYLGSAGTGDLVVLVGIDNTGANTTPNRFFFVTGNPTTFQGRVDSTIKHLGAGTKQIKWSMGGITVRRKVWVLVGFKESTRGKQMNLQSISFNDNA